MTQDSLGDSQFMDKSEWNEQMMFSRMFFSLSTKCRQSQIESNVMEWAAAIDTKISHVIGIIQDDEEDEKLDLARKKLLLQRSVVHKIPEMDSRPNLHKRSREEANLYYLCIEVESMVDKLVHSKMPFLKYMERTTVGAI